MTAASNTPLVLRFFEVWKESFAAVLGQVGVVSPVVNLDAPVPAAPLPPEELEKLMWGRFSAGGSLKGQLMLLVEKNVALQLAQLLMSEPLDPAAEFGDMQRDAFAELLRQVAGDAVTAWKQEVGAETKLDFQSAPETAFSPTQSATLRITGEKLPELSIRLLLDAEVFSTLSTLPPPEEPPEPQQAQTSGALPQNLDLILDVELQATIRFGEREMLLRDIFGLMPGAVVELNQLVNEPADLLVAGRLVARGEVVVVDGNFGLRVTDVISSAQRAELIQI